jgi:hypothetical protein
MMQIIFKSNEEIPLKMDWIKKTKYEAVSLLFACQKLRNLSTFFCKNQTLTVGTSQMSKSHYVNHYLALNLGFGKEGTLKQK